MKKVFFNSITFHDISFNELSFMFKKNLLITAPAAPALSNLIIDASYRNALMKSNINIFDSGLFCILLLFKGIKVTKFSGYKLLVAFLDYFKKHKINNIFFIEPSMNSSESNRLFLRSIGILPRNKSYIAPQYYDNFSDDKLIKIINKNKPKFIIINLGGGTQEKLGLWIQKNITYKAVIICTGAAISFLSGEQARIGKLVDNFYLGWLARCINNPKIFIPRYLKAFKFCIIFFKSYFKINYK